MVADMSASPLTPEQLEQLLPLAAAWVEEQEARALGHGIGLNPAQVADARQMGVTHPERVRLFVVPFIPEPEDPALRAAGELTGLINPFTAGITFRYGIYLRDEYARDRFLVAHELVHTGQYERFGSILAFLRQYLHECITIGYPEAPLEQEAILTSERLRDEGL
jgi:hypothetical protein